MVAMETKASGGEGYLRCYCGSSASCGAVGK